MATVSSCFCVFVVVGIPHCLGPTRHMSGPHLVVFLVMSVKMCASQRCHDSAFEFTYTKTHMCVRLDPLFFISSPFKNQCWDCWWKKYCQ